MTVASMHAGSFAAGSGRERARSSRKWMSKRRHHHLGYRYALCSRLRWATKVLAVFKSTEVLLAKI